MKKLLLPLLSCLLLSGCAGTSVVLLPDEDGTVGQVSISDGEDTRQLTRGRQILHAGNFGMSRDAQLPEERLQKTFGKTLSVLPAAPHTYIFYFDADSSTPTAASREQLARVVRDIQGRRLAQVLIAGHTDATGRSARNERLSRERAEAISLLLQDNGAHPYALRWEACGAREPSVSSTTPQPEPLNRRAEVFIR